MRDFASVVDGLRKALWSLPSRSETISACIKGKLDASYNAYCENVKRICYYLKSRSTIKVLKTIKREADKEAFDFD